MTNPEGTTTMNTDSTPAQVEQQRIDYDRLVAIAKARRPRVWSWWGIRGGATQKHAECYICDTWIDTWAARWKLPKHAVVAIDEHCALHLAELDEAEA